MALDNVEEIGARLSLKDRAKFSAEADKAAHDVRKIGDAADHADKHSRGAFGRIGGAFGHMAGKIVKYAGLAGGIVGIGGITVAMADGVKGAIEYQKIQAQTGAVLRSTHHEAGVTASQVERLGNTISDNSTFTTEAVQKGENLLLTFTGLKNAAGKGNDVFNQTTRTMTDMATALGEDTTAAAMQLGKALNDPIKGVSMLRRVGVSFTASQIEQIKAVTKAHGAMAGQKLMLRELQKEFGGSAKAASETFGGSVTRLKHHVEDFLRDLAKPLLGGFASGVTWLSDRVLPALERGLKTGHKWIHAFMTGLSNKGAPSEFGRNLQGAYAVGQRLYQGFRALEHGAKILWKEGILPVVHVIRKDLIPAAKNLYDMLMPQLWNGLKMVAAILIGGVVAAFKILGPIIKDVSAFLKEHKTLVQTLGVAILTAVVIFKAYTAAQLLGKKASTAYKDAEKALQTVMKANPYVRVAMLIFAIAAAVIYAYKHSATFRRIVHEAFHVMKAVVSDVWNWLKANWPYLLGILTGPIGLAAAWIFKHWDGVTKFFKGIPGHLKSIGGDIIDALSSPFKAAFNLIAGFWNNTAGKLHFHIPHWVPKIGGDGFSMPTIPTLHQGGTVRDSGLVNMKPGEEIVALPGGATVVPLNAGTVPSAVLGGEETPHVIQLVVDGKVLAETTHRHTRKAAARL